MKRLFFIWTVLLCNSVIAQLHQENLLFELKFGFMKGGEVTYQTRYSGNDSSNEIIANLHGFTTGFAKILYGVDDRYESYISVKDLLPTKSFKNLHEKDFHYLEEVTYDHQSGEVSCKRTGKIKTDKEICDVSSLMLNLRFSGKLDNLKLHQIIEIPFWDTGEWYILRFRYAGIEKIESFMGEVDCLRLEPMGITGRYFNKSNPMNVWVTNDDKKLPVLMELNFTIGSVKCKLVNAS